MRSTLQNPTSSCSPFSLGGAENHCSSHTLQGDGTLSSRWKRECRRSQKASTDCWGRGPGGHRRVCIPLVVYVLPCFSTGPSRSTFLFLARWVRLCASHTRLVDIRLGFCFCWVTRSADALRLASLLLITLTSLRSAAGFFPAFLPSGRLGETAPWLLTVALLLFTLLSVHHSPVVSFPSLETVFSPVNTDLLLVHFCPPTPTPTPITQDAWNRSRQTSSLMLSEAFASGFSGCPCPALPVVPLLWVSLKPPFSPDFMIILGKHLLLLHSVRPLALGPPLYFPQVQASHLDLNVLLTTQTRRTLPRTASSMKSQWKLLLTFVYFTLFYVCKYWPFLLYCLFAL